MTTDYYDHGSAPADNSFGDPAVIRAEFDLITQNISGKLPPLVGNGDKILAVNAGATALVSLTTTGTGNAVRATSPTLATPILGTPTSGVATNLTGLPLTTGVTGTLPVANGGTGVATTTAYSPVISGTTATGAFQAALGPGSAGQSLVSTGAGALPAWGTPAVPGLIWGLTMSTAGSSATMSIAVGQCANSTNAITMVLTAIAKTTSAWAVGTAAGGLDTGAIANSTWYNFYVIRRPDTGVVDVTFSINATTPTLPANYTQYRYIGSGKTNGSAQWTKFVQTGDLFLWDAAVGDVSTGAQSTTAILYTLSVPTGRKVEAYYNVLTSDAGTPALLITSPDESDQAPSAVTAPYYSIMAIGNATANSTAELRTMTNTSAQIRARATGAINTFKIATRGWRDTRGRDA